MARCSCVACTARRTVNFKRWDDDLGTHYFVATNWFRLTFTWQRGAW